MSRSATLIREGILDAVRHQERLRTTTGGRERDWNADLATDRQAYDRLVVLSRDAIKDASTNGEVFDKAEIVLDELERVPTALPPLSSGPIGMSLQGRLRWHLKLANGLGCRAETEPKASDDMPPRAFGT